MIKYFDYIFYRVSDLYINKWKDAQGMIFGIGVVSIMQMTHAIFILLVLALLSENINDLIFKQREGLNFMHSGIIYPCLLIITINFLRYLKFFPYEKAKIKWGAEDLKVRHKKGVWIIFYLILNLGLTILLSIYRKYY